MSIVHPLPIDAILADLRGQLADHSCVVLQAEPGAGKTTRVPLTLFNEPWLGDQKILMLEPRRLAAMNAARFMSQTLGEKVGNTIGYTIRHERCIGQNSRIEVITEGILTRRLQNDPMLDGVGLIIFDEFHERNIHSDLGLALSRDAQQGLRPDLKILVMSATLDTAALADLLDQCPVLTSVGRSYPIEIMYHGDDRTPLARQVLQATRSALQQQQGDILVFLPGEREIRTCQRLLNAQLNGPQDGDGGASAVAVLPLYGALSFAQQQLALKPAKQRKVVLATNIAETSLTIAGIGAVIDSGLERRLTFNPASGMNSLITATISQASATQRAGRAGRVQAGWCYRLWSETTHYGLPEYHVPEICRSDLAALTLDLVLWGIADGQQLTQLAWLDLPPKAHLQAAKRLLVQLGALDTRGRITSSGKQLARLPLHPRLAAMVVSAATVEQQYLACELAVLLEENFQLPPLASQVSTQSDLIDRLEYWRQARRAPVKDRQIGNCVRSLANLVRRLKLPVVHPAVIEAESVADLLLAAFPDRVAQRRQSNDKRHLDSYLLSSGTGAKLSPRCQVVATDWLVAVQVQHQASGESLIHQASALTRAQLLAYFERQLPWQDELVWDQTQLRVVGRQCRKLGALVLSQRPQAIDPSLALPLLITYIQRQGLDCLPWTKATRQWLQRVRFVNYHAQQDDWPAVDDAHLLAELNSWLAPWLSGVSSAAALRKIDLLGALHSLLNWSQRQQLEQLAPVAMVVPSGSRVTIDYSDSDQPVLAVKLQELFGWQASPRIAAGRVPLTIHLLSPARRPLQVTGDLANFWRSTYPEVKKQMKGRYPKHPWPDDPLVAIAQRGVKKR